MQTLQIRDINLRPNSSLILYFIQHVICIILTEIELVYQRTILILLAIFVAVFE